MRLVTKRRDRAPRADAQRNRDRILAVAAKAFSEVGAHVPLDDIARSAGIGNATLYRHFATRDLLLKAVYDERIDQLAAAAAAPADGKAEQQLLDWLGQLVGFLTRDRGLHDAYRELDDPEIAKRWQGILRRAAKPLVLAAMQAGSLPKTFKLEELMTLMHGIAVAAGGDVPRAQRLLQLAASGFICRPRLSAPAPATPRGNAARRRR
jgi:AcrR family transcriptional regulator